LALVIGQPGFAAPYQIVCDMMHHAGRRLSTAGRGMLPRSKCFALVSIAA